MTRVVYDPKVSHFRFNMIVSRSQAKRYIVYVQYVPPLHYFLAFSIGTGTLLCLTAIYRYWNLLREHLWKFSPDPWLVYYFI